MIGLLPFSSAMISYHRRRKSARKLVLNTLRALTGETQEEASTIATMIVPHLLYSGIWVCSSNGEVK